MLCPSTLKLLHGLMTHIEPEDHTWVTAYYFSPQLVRDALQRPDDLPHLYPQPNIVDRSQKASAEIDQIIILANPEGYKNWLTEQLAHIDAADRGWVASYYMNIDLSTIYERATRGENIIWNEVYPHPEQYNIINHRF
jgi:hypothetical protein